VQTVDWHPKIGVKKINVQALKNEIHAQVLRDIVCTEVIQMLGHIQVL